MARISPIYNYLAAIKRSSPQGYWTPSKIAATFLFFGETSKITGGKLYNQVSGATDYMTVTGTGLNAVYETGGVDADYITADTDYAWWKTDASRSVTDGNRLIAYDFARTIVKYDNASPYVIRIIAILKSGVVLTTDEINHLHSYFQLPLFWSGVENVHGVIKGNRGLVQSVWAAESVYEAETNVLIARMDTPSTALQVLMNDTIIDLKAGGYWTKAKAFSFLCMDKVGNNLNWKENRLNPTYGGVTTFDAKLGVNTAGADTSFIETGFKAVTESLTLNDCCFVIGKNIQTSKNGYDGNYQSLCGNILMAEASGVASGNSRIGSAAGTTPAELGFTGLKCANRRGATAGEIWINATLKNSSEQSLSPFTDNSVRIGALNGATGNVNGRNTFYWLGSSFSGQADWDAFCVIINNFTNSIAAM